ncbi:MAG: ATP-binding protein, partial [Gemmatimonadota bacterium]|nr:ATP-binding protein [Gemmatimonadota bacterium]
AAASRRIGFDKVFHHLMPLKLLGVRELLYGTIVIRKHDGSAPLITRRQELRGGATWRDIDWYIEFETLMAQPDASDRVLAMRPVARDGAAVAVRHARDKGEWNPTGAAVIAPGAFSGEMTGPTWLAAILARCDGTRTVRDLWQMLLDNGAIAPEWAPSELAAIVRTMIVAEILDVAEVPRP